MGEIIVSIDIGTSKVCTLIGRVNRENKIELLGKGVSACSGVKKGIIVDIESTSNSIKNSVQQAEAEAHLKVGSAFVNIAGAHVMVVNSRACVNVSNENREISAEDIERVLYTAKNVDIPEDMQLLDVIPKQFIIDGYDEIVDPIGMAGVKLEVDANIIAGKITSVQNIIKSMERANIGIDGIVVESLATSEMILTPNEKEIGVVLIDVGGGITDISVFKNNKLVFNDSIPVGGDHITNDVSIALRIPYSEAEKLKMQYEIALTSLVKNDQEVFVSDMGAERKKTIMVSEIVEIIEARVQEIFLLTKELLQRSNINCDTGVVLTGRGISSIDGSVELASEIFNAPVIIASYKSAGVSKPEFITAAGIIKYVSSYSKGSNIRSNVRVEKPKNSTKKTGFFKRIFRVFNDLFFVF